MAENLTGDVPKADLEDIRRVPIMEVFPNDYNPNKMAPHLFNEMGKDISEEGMDQPIVVVERLGLVPGGKWRVVDGEHRWRAHVAAGRSTILISVKTWDDNECKIRTIRRNFHGEIDPAKFTTLVSSLNSSGLSLDEIKRRMAMSDKEFGKAYRGNTEDKSKAAADLIATAEK